MAVFQLCIVDGELAENKALQAIVLEAVLWWTRVVDGSGEALARTLGECVPAGRLWTPAGFACEVRGTFAGKTTDGATGKNGPGYPLRAHGSRTSGVLSRKSDKSKVQSAGSRLSQCLGCRACLRNEPREWDDQGMRKECADFVRFVSATSAEGNGE